MLEATDVVKDMVKALKNFPSEFRKKYSELVSPFPDNAISWIINATSKDRTKANIAPYVDSHFLTAHVSSILGPMWNYEIKETLVKSDQFGVPIYAHVVSCVEIYGIRKCDIGTSEASFVVCPAEGKVNGKTCAPGKLVVSKRASAKSAASDAMKRTLRLFGIGLYLWFFPGNVWVNLDKYGKPEVGEKELKRLRAIGEKVKEELLKGI